jgi:nucleoside-diphosphate kinase
MASKYKTHPIPTERTFCMIKPDGVMRGLMGEIIKRFEQRGLKIIAMKMTHVSRDHVDAFYPKNPEWINRLGEKTLGTFTEYDIDPVKAMGTDSKEEIGMQVRGNLVDFIASGPVIPMVIEGIHGIAVVRKLIGATLPIFAEPGTVRGDYSHDAPTAANMENRTIFNLVHASETKDEAAHEIKHWFKEEEIFDYDRSDHVIMFGDKRNM